MVDAARLYVELWVSLASLLRSYTAAHGLNGNRQATVELGEERITVRAGEKWLELKRDGARVTWMREDETGGTMEMTEHGRLRWCFPTHSTKDVEWMGHSSSGFSGAKSTDQGDPESGSEEEMDIVAEQWAREMMR